MLDKNLKKEINSNKYEITDTGIYLPGAKVSIGGTFITSVNGKDVREDRNLVVNEGLNYILNAAIAAQTVSNAWYVGVFKNNYTPITTSVGSTFPGAGVAGEATTEYNEANRPVYTISPSTAQSLSNISAPASFTFNATTSIYGAFLVSTLPKADLTGKLLCAAKFASVRNLVSTDILSVTYTLNIASA